jgi:hypothetical protein
MISNFPTSIAIYYWCQRTAAQGAVVREEARVKDKVNDELLKFFKA